MELLKYEIKRDKILNIFQIYAPTSISPKEDYDTLLESLEKNIHSGNGKDKLIIMGDFNSQIGEREDFENEIMGPYNYGKRNERGRELIQFCRENRLKIVNTFFKHRRGKRWTWISPNQNFKSQIDYMLVPQIYNEIKNFTVRNFPYLSDHRLIFCEIEQKSEKKPRPNVNQNKIVSWYNASRYEAELSKILTGNEISEQSDTEDDYKNLICKLKKASSKINSKDKDNNKNNKIPRESVDLIKKRGSLWKKSNKSNTEKIELNITCKLIKIKLREYNRKKEENTIKEILETTKSIKNIKKKARGR